MLYLKHQSLSIERERGREYSNIIQMALTVIIIVLSAKIWRSSHIGFVFTYMLPNLLNYVRKCYTLHISDFARYLQFRRVFPLVFSGHSCCAIVSYFGVRMLFPVFMIVHSNDDCVLFNILNYIAKFFCCCVIHSILYE